VTKRTILVAVLVVATTACGRAGERNAADSTNVEEHIVRIEAGLPPTFTIRGELPARVSIQERMRQLGVPGVSVAVVNDGRIEWARAWGVADTVTGRPVTGQSLFQAASISKPVAALAALRLVEAGRVDLDEDVNTYLTSWKVPDNEFTTGQKVTLRRLLTHTAGTSVWGFPGYGPDETVPSTVGVLEGEGNTDPVRVFQVPGSAARYSGGGYTIVQLLVSDVHGRPFHDVMRTEVLEPIGMTSSTFEQPIPESLRDDIAFAYRDGGAVVDGNWHTYPEQAAAGLWTTPSDLARYAMAVQRAARGGSEVITQETAREMLTPEPLNGHGLGPALDPDAGTFSHGGSNEGYRANFIAYTDEGRGAFVMTNSDNGSPLALQILFAIAEEYGWPSPMPSERVPVELDRPLLERWTGEYAVAELGVAVAVRIEGDTLRASIPGQAMTLIPTSDSTFFDRLTGQAVAFGTGPDSSAVLTVSGVTAIRN
jgi:CubicO group peptidase (beta-lactamase class C family)